MTVTTSYGTWYNRTGYGLTPSDAVTQAVNGGSTEWLERMETAGALDRIERDYRAAIDAALPRGISLVGNEFHGPDRSDPAYQPPADEEVDDIKEAVESVDLTPIIEKHDVDNGPICEDCEQDPGTQTITVYEPGGGTTEKKVCTDCEERLLHATHPLPDTD